MEEFWIIFGGCGAKGRLNDIYAFNFETNLWICLDPGYQVPLHYYLQDRDQIGSLIKAQWARKLKKVQAKKLVKSYIANIFFVKLQFWQF